MSITEPASCQAQTQPPGRTRPCYIGRSYQYLCQTENSAGAMFTYSHVPFGKVVWHR